MKTWNTIKVALKHAKKKYTLREDRDWFGRLYDVQPGKDRFYSLSHRPHMDLGPQSLHGVYYVQSNHSAAQERNVLKMSEISYHNLYVKNSVWQ